MAASKSANVTFWIDLAERGIKTFLQAFLAALLGSQIMVSSTFSVDSLRAALLGGLAAGVSAVSSLVSGKIGDNATASLVPALTAVSTSVVAHVAPPVVASVEDALAAIPEVLAPTPSV